MIQLRLNRITVSGPNAGKSYTTNLSPDVSVGTLRELFKNIERYVEKVPSHDRYNVFYTVGHGNGSSKQAWEGQDVIPFDVDNVIDEQGFSDNEKLIEVIFKAIGADPEKSIVVHSGNGLQILIQTFHPVLKTDESFFRLNKSKYDELCHKIDAALEENGLRGKMDESSFAPNRLLRLPGTENRKPDKKTRQATLLRRNLEPQAFYVSPGAPGVKAQKEDWEASPKDQIGNSWLVYSKVDSVAVEEGCVFLKHAKDHQDDINEPQWYALLSIVGRLEDGSSKAHEYSKDAQSYSERTTTQKLEQALRGSSPRTCKNINDLWGGCHSCPHQDLVKSPISIKREEFIATESSGFHSRGEKGGLEPEIEDLRKFFLREHRYKTHAKSGLVYVWSESEYEIWSKTEVRAFAHQNLSPKPQSPFPMTDFCTIVSNSNLIKATWFVDSIIGKINFKNGVYLIDSKELAPHNPDWGFLSTLPYDFDPEARCPVFDKFMVDITLGDIELETLLLEFIGYAICDKDYDHHKALLLLGEGSNGKSTFIQIMQALVGDKNVSSLTFDDLHSETSRSALQGKLLNTCEELSHKDIQDTGRFKSLFGGKTSGRRLYSDATEFQNLAKFVFAMNTLPVAHDSTKGYLRRLLLAPFDANFDVGFDADPRLINKMKLELSGIFNKVMAIYEKMLARGTFTECKRSQALLDHHKKELDPVGTWAKDHLKILPFAGAGGPHASVPTIYEMYQKKSLQDGERCPTKAHFLKKLSQHIPSYIGRYERHSIAGIREYILWGVEIIHSDARF